MERAYLRSHTRSLTWIKFSPRGRRRMTVSPSAGFCYRIAQPPQAVRSDHGTVSASGDGMRQRAGDKQDDREPSMRMDHHLIDHWQDRADRVMVERIVIGTGYTAVTTSDGGIGLAATGIASHDGRRDVADFEHRPAADLLHQLAGTDPEGRMMALAMVNALNHQDAQRLPDDPQNTVLCDRFNLLGGARVAMVGYFPPLVRLLESHGAPLMIIDAAKGIGDAKTFYDHLRGGADVLLMTATTIINRTTEAILTHAGPDLQTVLLGPSTPMVPDVFTHLPVHMLAGSAITDRDQALDVVRHGGGARDLKPCSRKVYQLIDPNRPATRR